MAITYPLTMPATPDFKASRFGAASITAVNESSLTGHTQVLGRVGDRWEATFSLPSMKRPQAAAWTAFFAALRGQFGTFYAGDPDARTPRGAATAMMSPKVNGAGQYGMAVYTKGWPNSTANLLRAGDYLAFGGQLFMALGDVSSNGSGIAAIDIYPAIRIATIDNDPITVINPRGIFRLSDNRLSWDVDAAGLYGFSFSATEVVVS